MLRRAKRLQSTFNTFCSQLGLDYMMLDAEEWRQIEYLLWITQPFYQLTTALSKTKDVTIHIVFGIYNKLFDHLELSIRQLQRKKVAWKQVMLTALQAARSKLTDYYRETDKVYGDLFAVGTILAPQNKMQFFSSSDWGKEWRERYRKSFEAYFEPYKERLSENQRLSYTQSSVVQTSEIEMLLAPAESCRPNKYNEVKQYLESGKYSNLIGIYLSNNKLGTVQATPRSFWKDHQDEFPALANLARDVLSIPATGAGVERLFNSARDICHYRRGSLNATTIQDLMMYMCTTRFEIEEEQLAFIKEYLSGEEIETASEEKSTQGVQDDLYPISDDEENDQTRYQGQSTVPIAFQGGADKRPRRFSGQAEEEAEEALESEDDTDLPLPDTQPRTSGRARKRSRLLEGYEVIHR